MKAINHHATISYLAAILFYILLPGCSPVTMLEMEGLMPAEISVPSSIQSLVLVSIADFNRPRSAPLKWTDQAGDYVSDSIISRNFVDGCSDALATSPRFAVFKPVIDGNFAGESIDPCEKMPGRKS